MPGRNAPDMIRIIPTITKHNSFFVLDYLRMKIAPKVERRTPACERLKLIASPILEIERRRKRFPAENSTPVIILRKVCFVMLPLRSPEINAPVTIPTD